VGIKCRTTEPVGKDRNAYGEISDVTIFRSRIVDRDPAPGSS